MSFNCVDTLGQAFTTVIDIVTFNSLQLLNRPLHYISLLAAEVCNVVLKYVELVRCCGLTLLLDDSTHAVLTHTRVEDIGHFEECLVRRVTNQLPVELRLQFTFQEVEL